MATYFNGNPEIQGDGLQTLILMNPPAGYVGYSDTQSTSAGNLVFLNSTASFPHAPDASSEISALHGILQRPPYWAPIDNPTEARGVNRQQQGLSLTLSPQQPPYIYAAPETVLSPPAVLSPPQEQSLPISLHSKYLKAAQQLLDEVVNVVGESRTRSKHFHRSPSAMAGSSELQIPEPSLKRDLTAAEKQEIQLKKTKLFSMLNQVEQKYREYNHQMSIVISTFEQIAGIGSARSYTALALQTISKQFRSLKDAINAQIRASNKFLGEEESAEQSRFKLVDHHIRQQRALQQLGMIQHNAWRPQRGLPERSVSILRAWLFEHFLHPYPKDSDKHMLAKQTGLTRSQVSNWFINARVRLWKPMVEEMYLEEIKEQEKKSISNPYVSKDSDNSTTQDSPKKQRTPEASVPSMAADVDPVVAGSSSPAPVSLAGDRDGYPGFVPGFGSYPIAARYSGNGVSLTLGLPHCDNLGISAAHQSFQLGRRIDMSEHDFGAAVGQPPHGYESIDMDSRKRFAAQLLPDFVT